ncbi:MAG: hypothetical protein Q4P20_10250 [Eubacteriales bacterium]|nr:hypothetical protein [Eubacteriales bacterium]
MLESAINKILELAKPNVEVLNDSYYSDKRLHRIDDELYAEPLNVHTLTSIVDYITSGTDDNGTLDGACDAVDIDRRFVVHIEDYDKVTLTRELSTDKRRERLLCATDDTRTFPFGQFLPVENFIIAMQAYFIQDDMTAQLVRLVSSVTDSNSVKRADNGLTQSVTAKTGIVTSSEIEVPNPVQLCPLCTFSEIRQPGRRFVFRLRGGDNGVTAALFEADGNAWKHEAILNIRDYLNLELREMLDDVIILA